MKTLNLRKALTRSLLGNPSNNRNLIFLFDENTDVNDIDVTNISELLSKCIRISRLGSPNYLNQGQNVVRLNTGDLGIDSLLYSGSYDTIDLVTKTRTAGNSLTPDDINIFPSFFSQPGSLRISSSDSIWMPWKAADATDIPNTDAGSFIYWCLWSLRQSGTTSTNTDSVWMGSKLNASNGIWIAYNTILLGGLRDTEFLITTGKHHTQSYSTPSGQNFRLNIQYLNADNQWLNLPGVSYGSNSTAANNLRFYGGWNRGNVQIIKFPMISAKGFRFQTAKLVATPSGSNYNSHTGIGGYAGFIGCGNFQPKPIASQALLCKLGQDPSLKSLFNFKPVEIQTSGRNIEFVLNANSVHDI